MSRAEMFCEELADRREQMKDGKWLLAFDFGGNFRLAYLLVISPRSLSELSLMHLSGGGDVGSVGSSTAKKSLNLQMNCT